MVFFILTITFCLDYLTCRDKTQMFLGLKKNANTTFYKNYIALDKRDIVYY